MSECDDSVDKAALPKERAQPQGPLHSGNDQERAEHGGHFLEDIIATGSMNSQRAETKGRTVVLDNARFTAGVVGLYEAILSEPIPDKMLRLIEEIGKQERKS
jgi:hypothetical protein